MILALNTNATGPAPSFEALLAAAAKYGYGGIDYGIEPALQLAERTSVRAVWEQFAKANVQLAVWGLPVEFRRDEAAFQRGLADLPKKAAFARELGATRCATWIPPTVPDGESAAHYALVVARRLRECAAVLGDYGVRFGLEWVGPKTLRAGKTPFVWTMEQVLDLGAATGCSNVGLLVDCWHWYVTGGTQAQLEALSPEQIVHVHINDAPQKPVDEQIDNQRLLPGTTGVIDLGAFFAALRAVGYAGPVAVEPFDKSLPALGFEAAAAKTAAAALPYIQPRV